MLPAASAATKEGFCAIYIRIKSARAIFMVGGPPSLRPESRTGTWSQSVAVIPRQFLMREMERSGAGFASCSEKERFMARRQSLLLRECLAHLTWRPHRNLPSAGKLELMLLAIYFLVWCQRMRRKRRGRASHIPLHGEGERERERERERAEEQHGK